MAAQTFTFLAPNAGQIFSVQNNSVRYTADALGLVTGVPVGNCRDLVAAGCVCLGPSAVNDAAAWNQNLGVPQTLACTGATVGGAAKITSPTVNLTTTTSAEGAVLKLVATGAKTFIRAPVALNAKIYSPPGTTLDANASATATVISAAKGLLILQTSATHFITLLKGA